MAQKYDEILDLYVQGLDDAMNNAAYAKNTTGEGDVRFMARYEKQGGMFSDALTGAEWTKYNHAISTKIDKGLRVSENSVLVECEEGNLYDYKFVIYDNTFEDNPIQSIYAIGNLGYNVPEANEIARYIQSMEDKDYDRQKVLKKILRRHAEEFGYVLRGYNTKTRRYNYIGGTFTQNRTAFVNQSNGTAVYSAAGQLIKKQSRVSDDLFDMVDDLFTEETAVENIIARHYATHAAEIGEVLRNTADIGAASIRSLQIKEKQTPYDKRKTVASVKRQSFAVNS